MAHIEKRNDRWRARYRGPDGRERNKTFDRKVDAEVWLAAAKVERAKGQWIDPQLGQITFGDWVNVWKATVVDLKPTTRALNFGTADRHLIPRFGTWPLTRIQTSDVKVMVAEELASGRWSNSSVRRHAIVLSVILRAAVDDQRIGRNPCEAVKLPPESARPMRFLTPDEIARLADAIEPGHYRALVLTAGYVGLRWGELAGLRVGRVDTLRNQIRVEEQLVEVGGKVSFGSPKTKAGVRTVSMPAGLSAVLAEHMGSEVVRDSGMVFPTARGTLMRRGGFRRVWRRACTAAGFDGGPLDGLVFHELRHTAAALAIAQGAHPVAIKERLGHSSITVTMDRYGGLFPGLDDAIGEGLDAAFGESLAASPRPEDSKVVELRTAQESG